MSIYMMDLPFDVKCIIAGFFQEVWYAMYLMEGPSSEFRKYAESRAGIARFAELFTVVTVSREKIRYQIGKQHRGDDIPAVITRYRLFGKRHRGGDLPAVTTHTRDRITQWWFCNDRLHRDGDQPAIVQPQYRAWYQHGKCHRDNNAPAEENPVYGGKVWRRFGRIERPSGGPVITAHNIEYYTHDAEQLAGGLEYQARLALTAMSV